MSSLATYPPENSPYGRNGSEFFGHILAIIYRYNYVTTFFICGDFNSRLGGKVNYIESIDECSPRQILDKNVNKHGESFLEFLKNAISIVVNGRITPEHNHYTSVTVKGKSVVDHIAVPIDSIEYCKKVKVGVLRPVQQPGSYWDRSSELPLVGLEPTEVTAYD